MVKFSILQMCMKIAISGVYERRNAQIHNTGQWYHPHNHNYIVPSTYKQSICMYPQGYLTPHIILISTAEINVKVSVPAFYLNL